jgi:hypothetical protein
VLEEIDEMLEIRAWVLEDVEAKQQEREAMLVSPDDNTRARHMSERNAPRCYRTTSRCSRTHAEWPGRKNGVPGTRSGVGGRRNGASERRRRACGRLLVDSDVGRAF